VGLAVRGIVPQIDSTNQPRWKTGYLKTRFYQWRLGILDYYNQGSKRNEFSAKFSLLFYCIDAFRIATFDFVGKPD
jgi:hypothetical protein